MNATQNISDNILDKISEKVRLQILKQKSERSYEDLERSLGSYEAKDFEALFLSPQKKVKIIAEIKFASPSEGDLAPGGHPVQIAGQYLDGGAAALSVLTETDFFKGDPAYLKKIREAFPQAYLLMKDFLLEDYQLLRAKADGADAVLLIVALLGEKKLRHFMAEASKWGLSTLVEVHNEEELEMAFQSGATLVGINNRNLKTMEVSLETSERLMDLAPESLTLVSESGLQKASDLKRLNKIGYQGFLIGSSFMKSADPGLALKKLIEECGDLSLEN